MYLKLDDAIDRVCADDAGKWDTLVPRRDLGLRDGRLTFTQARSDGLEDGLTLTPWALSQACQRLTIPAAYFKKCPASLQDCQFNHWLREGEDETPWFIRAKGACVRGVLSERYARLDNKEVLTTLRSVLADTSYQVGLCQITGEAFHLRLVNPGLFLDVRPNDRLFAGFHLANSEVGYRSVTIEAMIFRLVCTNGLIRRVNSQSLFKQRHAFLSPELFRARMADALAQAAVVAAGFLEQIAQAARLPVPKPEQAVTLLTEAWNLSQTTDELIRFTLAGEKDAHTLYGLVNGITAAAQRLSIEERYALEVHAGQLIDGAGAEALLRRRILSLEEGGQPWQLTKAA